MVKEEDMVSSQELSNRCDDCTHGYITGLDCMCSNGKSKYFGTGYLSRRNRCCDMFEKREEKRSWYRG